MRDLSRRGVIGLVGGAAAWPMTARAQQRERIRRIGVLLPASPDDPVWQARLGAFLQGLGILGWGIGQNLRIETRWATPNLHDLRRHSDELAALAPDVILAGGGSSVGPLLESTRTVPVVFTVATDPVGAGYVDNLARPSGNATGFLSFEFSLSAKWLELLKLMAPRLMRVAVLRDATQNFAMSSFAAVQAVAPSLGVEVIPINMRDAGEIEQSVAIFARSPNGGLIPMASAAAIHHRDLILALASRHSLPAVYWDRFFVDAGGLMSYGPDLVDQFRRAANYVDRILKGEKPADLPVQAPTKFELLINVKSAKTLGLDVPPTLLARADEVIE